MFYLWFWWWQLFQAGLGILYNHGHDILKNFWCFTKFTLSEKKNVSQTFESSSCQKVFPKCVYHWYNLLWWMFFIPCDIWKTLFFVQIHCYPEVWYNRNVAAFFQTSVLNKVRILYLFIFTWQCWGSPKQNFHYLSVFNKKFICW